MKNCLPVLLTLALGVATCASAEVVSSHSAAKGSKQSQMINTLSPSVSIVEASSTSLQGKGTKNSVTTDSSVLFLPANSTTSLFTTSSSSSGKKGKKAGGANANSLVNDIVTTTPEPASLSLVLIGLFGAALFARRSYARQS